MYCSETCWFLGGAWFQCRYGGFWVSSCLWMFPESGVLWCSQGLELSLLPLAFSLILTEASRLLHLYSTDDKTSRLMVKQFSTVRETQGGSQSYMEKRRGRREIEVTKRRRGGVKWWESNLATNQFPKCFPQSGTPRDIQSCIEKRRGREEIEVTWGRIQRVKRGESNQASNHTPKWKKILRLDSWSYKIDSKYQKAKIKNLE